MVCYICTRLDPSEILVLYCLNFLEIIFFCSFVQSFSCSFIFEAFEWENEKIFVSLAVQQPALKRILLYNIRIFFASYSVSMSVGFFRQCLFSFLFNLFDFVLIFILFVLCDLNTTYIYRSMHEHSICVFFGVCVLSSSTIEYFTLIFRF